MAEQVKKTYRGALKDYQRQMRSAMAEMDEMTVTKVLGFDPDSGYSHTAKYSETLSNAAHEALLRGDVGMINTCFTDDTITMTGSEHAIRRLVRNPDAYVNYYMCGPETINGGVYHKTHRSAVVARAGLLGSHQLGYQVNVYLKDHAR